MRVVTLFSTQDCFVEIGDSGVEANTSNSHFLSGSIPYDISLGAETDPAENDKYVAVIQAANSRDALHL